MAKKLMNSLPSYLTLGTVGFLASTFIGEAIIYPVLDKLITTCQPPEGTGFLVDGASFECVHTPFFLVGIAGSLFLLAILLLLKKVINVPIKRLGLIMLSFIALTWATNWVWKELLVTNQSLTSSSQLGFTYLITWIRIVAGMVLGALMAVFAQNKLTKPKASLSKARTSTKSKVKKTASKAKKTTKK